MVKEGTFDEVDKNTPRTITLENIDAVNAIFFKHYKDAKADNY